MLRPGSQNYLILAALESGPKTPWELMEASGSSNFRARISELNERGKREGFQIVNVPRKDKPNLYSLIRHRRYKTIAN